MEKLNSQPELHNEEIEAEIKDFATNQNKENMVKILQGLSKAMIMQPALFPKATTPEELKKIMQGQGDPSIKPQPVVLKNKDGSNFVPVFTSKEQIPQEQKYPAIMFMPFMECVKIAAKPEFHMTGIVVNPFTNNMIIHQPALEMLLGKPQEQKVTMTGAQMQVFLRNQVELMELPKKLYTEKEKFIQELTEKKEEYMADLYQEVYSKVKGLENKSPYTKKDFEMMSLNISDTLQMVQIGMPDSARVAGQCLSVFLFFNPQSGEAVYYTIKLGTPEQGNTYGSINQDGTYTDLGAAPEDGSELYTLMDIVPWNKASES